MPAAAERTTAGSNPAAQLTCHSGPAHPSNVQLQRSWHSVSQVLQHALHGVCNSYLAPLAWHAVSDFARAQLALTQPLILRSHHGYNACCTPDGEHVSQETHEFVKKVFEKSGIDNNGSYLPKNLHPQHTLEPVGGQDESFAEARLVMGGAVEEVLRKTGGVQG